MIKWIKASERMPTDFVTSRTIAHKTPVVPLIERNRETLKPIKVFGFEYFGGDVANINEVEWLEEGAAWEEELDQIKFKVFSENQKAINEVD